MARLIGYRADDKDEWEWVQLPDGTWTHRPRQRLITGSLVAVVVMAAAFLFGGAGVPSADAQSANVTIEARERGTGLPITDFRYTVNVDIAHENSSSTPPESYSPVAATGDNTNATVLLPDGKYLVTVLAGHIPDPPDAFTSPYKMWGQHFTVAGTDQTITVEMVPNPLPLSTLRARVFHNNHPVNEDEDVPVEGGLAGFHILPHDPVGEVTVDFFGNPICTEYDGSLSGSTPLGDPVPGTGGACLTDSTGHAVIPNMPPGLYETSAIPPDGQDWYQVTTLEGSYEFPGWLEEGASGFSSEKGFLQDVVWFGFVRPCSFGDPTDDCLTNNTAGTGTITGTVRQFKIDNDAPGVPDLGSTVPYLLVALNNISGDDEQVWMGKGNPDGTFTIPNVPPGQYQVVFWDEFLDYIVSFRTVSVGVGETVAMGDVGVPRWYGSIRGYAYLDTGVAKDGTPIAAYANGFRDCYDNGIDNDGDLIASEIEPHDIPTCEPGIPGQDLDIRHKDGTIQYATFADSNGYYEFPEHFEWEHFLVWEVGYGRFEQGATTAYEANEFGEPVGYPYSPINQSDPGPAGLLQAEMTWGGFTNWIDTGKLPWGPGENGGIAGIVYYATTRNEFNPRYAAAEDYEPGVPGVTVNLYSAVVDGAGNPTYEVDGSVKKGALLNTVGTDSWYENLPTGCVVPDTLGIPSFVDPLCLELPSRLNQVKDGVFDGGYAFVNTCLDPAGLAVTDPEGDVDIDTIPNKFDPDHLLDEDGGFCSLLPGAKYVTEVVPPDGYQVIKEEDQNTDQGDDFVPLVPPAPCAGALHLVNDPRNPADGTDTPLCDHRFISLVNGYNAPSDFSLMIDNALPPPGLVRGLLLDDLMLELDPTSPVYAEKRGVPDTPVGVRDFQGNLLTTVYSDENGHWEVLLPSSYTALCPIPSGICPGVYNFVGNDPGDPLNPDPKWNPNYMSLTVQFDVWPGKWLVADVAMIPSTGFIGTPTSQFQTPPVCNIATTTPSVMSVSPPYGRDTDSGVFTISGTGFEDLQGVGKVTLDGVELPVFSWSDTAIEVEFVQLALVGVGPHQLLVTNDSGATSPSGITFHALGVGYDPPLVHVDITAAAGGDGSDGMPFNTVQDGLDAAADGDLVIVHPGYYYENVILYENVKLQGFGPGASGIDGRFFNNPGGMTPDEFIAKLGTIAFDGPAPVPMGQTITVLAEDGEFGSAFTTQIDGLVIRGGQAVKGNAIVGSQGGGIYGHAFARHLQVSNNLVQNNSGNFGGGVVLGQAYTANPDAGGAMNSQNDSVRIHHNRILNNGGAVLSGGIGLFNGTENYEIDHNVICGNHSAEYGGGISNFGLSSGHIHHNEVLFNYAFDEGGGLMIAGELDNDPFGVSPGTGNVLVEANRFQGNMSNDDGGGIRLLQPVDGYIRIINNIVVNNLATDTGGGISMDDAMAVEVVNNTVARNISTATAEDADRSTCSPPALGSCPHSAGLVTEPHSAALIGAKALDCTVDACFSNPVLFNNIFWHNEAFYLDGTSTIFGGGLPSAGYIDLEVLGGAGNFDGHYNDCTAFSADCPDDGTNISSDPLFTLEVTTTFHTAAFGGDPTFITVRIISTPADSQGDYHIPATSPAHDAGTLLYSSVAAPGDDFDGDFRPDGQVHDMGADEFVDGSGPASLSLAVGPNPTVGVTTVTLTATVSDATTGNSDIAEAEYFINTAGADGTGTAMSAVDLLFFDEPVEPVTASVDISSLADGSHILYVHGRDSAGFWGPVTAVSLVKSSPPPPPMCGGYAITIFGTAANNTINGTAGVDVIDGMGGNDTINGLGGNDVICGGDGNDKISGGTGTDTIYGGIGNDVIKGGSDGDTIYGEAGTDEVIGEAGTDTLYGGSGNDKVKGGDHNDSLFGEGGDDRLQGGGGVDACDGGIGAADTAVQCEFVVDVP